MPVIKLHLQDVPLPVRLYIQADCTAVPTYSRIAIYTHKIYTAQCYFPTSLVKGCQAELTALLEGP